MEEDDVLAPKAPESASPKAFDRLVETRRFFSDSDPDELDGIDLSAREEGDAVGVIDLYSDSDGDLDGLDRVGAVAGGLDADADRDGLSANSDLALEIGGSASIADNESQGGYVADGESKTDDDEEADGGPISEQKSFIESRVAYIRAQMETLGAMHDKAVADTAKAARMSEAELREAVEARKLVVQALRDEIGATKRAFAAYPVETKEILARCGLLPHTTKECFDDIYRAYAAVKGMAAPAGTEVTVLDKWSVESWASASRLNWSAKRYPNAEPAVANTASVTRAWQQLTTPDTLPQRHCTLVRVEASSLLLARNGFACF